MDFIKKYWGVFLFLLLSLFSVTPFFENGFFFFHDDTQVARVFEMGKALKDGIFPVRWVADLGYGYGYPIFNFYAPLSYYIGGFLNLIGFDALVATKIMMVLGIILAGLFMYLLAKEFFGNLGGTIAGIAYVYAPYHAVDIYVRGDVTEFWAYAFIPLMFWGFYRVFATSNKKISNFKFPISNFQWIVVGALGYAGVILSHNLTAMMVTPFLLVVILIYCYIALKNKKYSSMFYVLGSMFLGILISSFYWLPALTEMKYTNVMSQIGGGADYKDHFVCVQQLWNSQWGFGGSTKGCIDGMSFKLGKFNILLSIVSLALSVIFFNKNKFIDRYSKEKIVILLSIAGFIISIFFMLDVSKFFWQALPLMSFFQYPWRFLILSSLFSSLLIGSIVWFIKEISKRYKLSIFINYVFAGILIFLLLIVNAKLFVPQKFINKSVKDYTSDYELKWRVSKLSDEYLPQYFIKPQSFAEIKKEKITQVESLNLKMKDSNTKFTKFVLETPKENIAFANIAYFPSWQLYVDGKREIITDTGSGMVFLVKQGTHEYDLIFKETFMEKLANILSLTGIFILILGIIYSRGILNPNSFNEKINR